MTSDERNRNDDCSRRQGNARSSAPRVAADGGPSPHRLFHAFPDPLVYYETEQDAVDDETEQDIVDDESELDAAVVRAVNPAFERIFDVDESAITGERLVDRLLAETDDPEPAANWVVTDAAGNATYPDETGDPEIDAEDVLARLAEGERVTVGFRRGTDDEYYFRLEAIPALDGETGGYVVYTRVTDFQQQVQTLGARADRLERVASITAHDLRNPLDVAEIRLEAARDTGEEVHFEKIEGALDRIQHIVQNVLSVGGGEVDPTDAVVLDDVVQAAWSTVETADAALVLDDDLPTIEADADNLQQVFENLFRNAVEHGSRDVTVTVGNLIDGFYVADDGPGIPSTERGHAFDPNYSTTDDDTGLGLAIVQQIVEDHGWQVAITASDAGGARFEFTGVEPMDVHE